MATEKRTIFKTLRRNREGTTPSNTLGIPKWFPALWLQFKGLFTLKNRLHFIMHLTIGLTDERSSGLGLALGV